MNHINATARGGNSQNTVAGRNAALNQASHDEILTRITSLPGGAVNMDMFSTRNHVAGTYTRNTSLWCADLVPQLTACVIAKYGGTDGWNDQIGGIAITPRHVLYTGHSFPQAAGTWPVWLGAPPTIVRFVTEDGTVVDKTQIHQSTSNTGSAYTPQTCTSSPLGALDCAVGVLDSDLPESIHIMPLGPAVAPALLYPSDPYSTMKTASFALSQGAWVSPTWSPPTPISDYPQVHSQMVYINGPGAPFNLFDYAIWPGDSGTPEMRVQNSVVSLFRVISGTQSNQEGMAAHYNCLIAAANANAVSLGRMTPGEADYQVTVLPWT